MCYFKGQAVGEYCNCCQKCTEFRNSCIPIADSSGWVYGECDFDFCNYCPCYVKCEMIWGKVVCGYEADEL